MTAKTPDRRRPPSAAMICMLGNLNKGKPWFTGLTGRSEHGGGMKTLYALKARGYIANVGTCTVTDVGRSALEKYA